MEKKRQKNTITLTDNMIALAVQGLSIARMERLKAQDKRGANNLNRVMHSLQLQHRKSLRDRQRGQNT